MAGECGRHPPPRQTPLWAETHTASEAGGMHPTGIHSSFYGNRHNLNFTGKGYLRPLTFDQEWTLTYRSARSNRITYREKHNFKENNTKDAAFIRSIAISIQYTLKVSTATFGIRLTVRERR